MKQRHPLGETRTSVQSDHALIGTDSHVPASLFGWEATQGVMLVSPAMSRAGVSGRSIGSSGTRGPGFAMYLADLDEASSTKAAPAGVQRVVYVLQGSIFVDSCTLLPEHFAYLPADSSYDLRCKSSARLLVFEKRYEPLPEVARPELFVSSLSQKTGEPFLGDPDLILTNLLPDHPAFDMAVNVFTYQSGGALPLVETHIMEHGLYMTQGQGVYRLNQSWYPVAKDDAIWMAAYCPQWFVAMGGNPAQYVYYKDVNRYHLPLSAEYS